MQNVPKSTAVGSSPQTHERSLQRFPGPWLDLTEGTRKKNWEKETKKVEKQRNKRRGLQKSGGRKLQFSDNGYYGWQKEIKFYPQITRNKGFPATNFVFLTDNFLTRRKLYEG